MRKDLGVADDATERAANRCGPFEARVASFDRRLRPVGAPDARAGPAGVAELAESSAYGAAPVTDDRNAEPRVPLNVPTPEAREASGGRAVAVGGDRRLKAEGASERAEDVARPPEYGAVPLADDRAAEPDVLLDVPTLKVDEITLEVADLRARVSLNAEVLDLLRLHVGADVGLGRVNLGIKGVEAQALLKVRLDNVAAIIKDVLQTIDNNPQLLENITTTVARAVDDVGTAAGRAVGDIGTSTGQAVSGAVRGLAPGVASTAQKVGETAEGLASGTPAATRSIVGNTTADPSPPLPGRPVRHDPTSRRAPEEKAPTDPHPSAPEPTETGGDQAAKAGEAHDQRQPGGGGPADEAPEQTPEAAPDDTDRQDVEGDAPQEVSSHIGRLPVQDAHEPLGGEAVDTEHAETRPDHPERPGQPERPERPERPGQPGPDEPVGGPRTARPPSPALGSALRELGRAAGHAGLRKLRDLRR